MNTLEVVKEVVAEQSREVFYIHRGITLNQVDQLIAFTQAEIDQVKLDGDGQRFMSRQQYEVWKRKRRMVYSLTDCARENGNFCGIFWAGQKELPPRTDYLETLDPKFYQHTYAFRLYGCARGQGLSHIILSTCMGDYISRLVLPLGSWLEVSGSNPAALHMDQKMGYRIVSGLNEQGRLVLARIYQESG